MPFFPLLSKAILTLHDRLAEAAEGASLLVYLVVSKGGAIIVN